jgi:hypothetical protein
MLAQGPLQDVEGIVDMSGPGKASSWPFTANPANEVAQQAHDQSTAEVAGQVSDDRTFFAALLKELDIKLE